MSSPLRGAAAAKAWCNPGDASCFADENQTPWTAVSGMAERSLCAGLAHGVRKCVPIVFRIAVRSLVLAAVVLPVGCGSSPAAPDQVEVCAGYQDWQTSAYVLPYAAGASYLVSQGN